VIKIGEAYKELSKASLVIKNPRCEGILEEVIEAIVLKGLYYLRVLAEYNFNDNNSMLKDLN
jgi:hypothetical protein